jgi:hypothetical protein
VLLQPAASTFTSTSPAAGRGTATWRSSIASSPPWWVVTAASMVSGSCASPGFGVCARLEGMVQDCRTDQGCVRFGHRGTTDVYDR